MNNTQSPHACGAWIEVCLCSANLRGIDCRPTHVGRGLKAGQQVPDG